MEASDPGMSSFSMFSMLSTLSLSIGSFSIYQVLFESQSYKASFWAAVKWNILCHLDSV